MTNKIYYQSKNPIACIAFANWLLRHFTNHYGQWDIRVSVEDKYQEQRNLIPSIYDENANTQDLYQFWENLEVDKTLAKDEINITIENNEVQYLREQQEYNNTGYIEPDEL